MADDAMAASSAEKPTTSNDDTTEPKSSDVEITQEDEQTAGKIATTQVNAPEGDDTTEAAVGPSTATAATPKGKETATPKRIAGGASEKKAKGKRKSLPVLQLDCKPGEYYFARLKGHPPWPAIVCDEQMLPESLLATRPVSTARPDGTLRDDFKDGGKNAKERTFPIMFLHTNEFAWIVNTSLTPLDPKECETLPDGKMTKALQSAYKVAAENHDLNYFKGILKAWQEEQAQIEQENREYEERAAQEEEKKQRAANGDTGDSKGKKKKVHKSKGADEDVEMVDADEPKSSKKRKKEDHDTDNTQPKKTPKVTKINAPKTPGDSTAKKSAKPKKKVVVAPKDEEDEKPQMSEGEKLAQREKAVLYLRHRLQKGFLSRDQAPQETEMATMADFFKQLETHENLEPAIIRNTKIHKVLKAIVKLSSIPKDEEYNFKKRSSAMLDVWNRRMEADGGQANVSATKKKEEDVVEEKEKTEESNGVGEATDAPAQSVEKKADGPEVTDAAKAAGAPVVNGTASDSPAPDTGNKDSEEADGNDSVDENVPVEVAA